MCGVVGYVGENNSVDILMDGLYSLEYREYDGGNNIKGVYILLGQDKVEAKFTETGYLYLKPYESGSTITLALTKKS